MFLASYTCSRFAFQDVGPASVAVDLNSRVLVSLAAGIDVVRARQVEPEPVDLGTI